MLWAASFRAWATAPWRSLIWPCDGQVGAGGKYGSVWVGAGGVGAREEARAVGNATGCLLSPSCPAAGKPPTPCVQPTQRQPATECTPPPPPHPHTTTTFPLPRTSSISTRRSAVAAFSAAAWCWPRTLSSSRCSSRLSSEASLAPWLALTRSASASSTLSVRSCLGSWGGVGEGWWWLCQEGVFSHTGMKRMEGRRGQGMHRVCKAVPGVLQEGKERGGHA
jgi:hypothetical protein